MTGNTSIKHSNVDRVLMRVCAGPCSPEELRECLRLGTGIILRAATVLQGENLLARRGVGRLTIYEITEEGRAAVGRLRRGGSREKP